jgi:hypothetical protein
MRYSAPREFQMHLHTFAVATLLVSTSVVFADEITEAIDQARKSYESGDLGGARQSLDLASQLVGQKNAENFGALLPPALPGWKAGEVQTTAVSIFGFNASSATRTYTNAKNEEVDVNITGDSAMITQFASLLANPQIAGLSGGKIVRIGTERAFQDKNGDINMVVANKYLIVVKGSGPPDLKLAYAQAIDLAKLTKM